MSGQDRAAALMVISYNQLNRNKASFASTVDDDDIVIHENFEFTRRMEGVNSRWVWKMELVAVGMNEREFCFDNLSKLKEQCPKCRKNLTSMTEPREKVKVAIGAGGKIDNMPWENVRLQMSGRMNGTEDYCCEKLL